MRNKHPLLQWTEREGTGDRHHHWHIARDAKDTVYHIKPVYYSRRSGGKFAGYRVKAGNVWIRGWTTTLHEAKAKAQRFSNRQNNLTVKKYKSRGKRVLDLTDSGPIEIAIPVLVSRRIDLD